MNTSNIAVDLRLSTKADSKVKAFADVTIPLGSEGLVKISGFSVIQSDSQPPRVVPPAQRGSSGISTRLLSSARFVTSWTKRSRPSTHVRRPGSPKGFRGHREQSRTGT